MKQELVHMETAIPGLYASAPEPLPCAPSLEIRAFLLRRDQGQPARLQRHHARVRRGGMKGSAR